MSVCIAAVSADKALVVGADHMASLHGGAFSGELAMLKGRELGGGWVVLFAGDDITPATPIIRGADELLDPGRNRTDLYTVDEVSAALRHAYQEERTQRATDAHLSIYGISMATFRTEGVKTFGDAGATILRDRIEREELRCDFLAAGHAPNGKAYILTIEHPGTIKHYDTPGYWAIGSGSYLALASLLERRQNVLTPLPTAIYNVCEAKFNAETALGVGRVSMFLRVSYSDGTFQTLDEIIGEVKQAWMRHCRPKYPPDIVKKIEEMVAKTPHERSLST